MSIKFKKIAIGLCILLLSTVLIAGCQKNENKRIGKEDKKSATTTQVEKREDTLADEKESAFEETASDSSEASTEQIKNQQIESKKPQEQKEPIATEKQNISKTPNKDEKNLLQFNGSGIESPISISLEELKNMKGGVVEDDYFSLNSYGTKEYFHFKGVAIGYLLNQKVKFKKGATKVKFIAEDGYTIEYHINEVMKEDYIDEQNPDKKYKMIIAWEENGKAYNPKQGKPFRLVVGQKGEGDINKPNWVQNIKSIQID